VFRDNVSQANCGVFNIKVALLMIVRFDTIYFAQDSVSEPRMKHLDIRYHFV
jgi:hypothetical protein